MNADLPPEVIEQVRALADYARHHGYAQVTIMSNRKAYFKREGSPLLTKEGWDNKLIAALRVVAIVWIAVSMIWAYIIVGTSLVAPRFDIAFGWGIILLASPWLSGMVATGVLFNEGPEAKSMMSLALFVAGIFIGLAAVARPLPFSNLFLVMGVPCLLLAYFGDMRRATSWLVRQREKMTLVK